MLEARTAVKNLHAYRPPLAGRQGLRLDFNESTIGCSPRVLAKLRAEQTTIPPGIAAHDGSEFTVVLPNEMNGLQAARAG